MLYEKIKLNLRGKVSYPYRQPSPSTLSSCSRLLWYKVHEPHVVESNTPELELIFDDGNAGEEQMIRLIQEVGEYTVTHRQARVVSYIGKHRSSGKIDGVASGNQIAAPGLIFDTKRLNPFVWDEFERFGIDGLPHYQDQLTPYILGAPESLGIKENKAILFAMNRENADIFDDLVILDQERVDKLAYMLDNREEILSSPKEPLRPFARASSECKTCPARDYCWAMESTGTLTLGELEPSDAEEAAANAIDFTTHQGAKRDEETKLDELKAYFDSLLEKYDCKSILIKVGDDLTVRPNIRAGTRREFDELALSYALPEVHEPYTRADESKKRE